MRLPIAVAFAFILGCTGGSLATRTQPAWLTQLIQQQESQPAANPPAFIASYAYQGRTVYYLPPRCCDIWSTLYADDGSIICHPDGGLTGHGDGLCSDFLAQRTNEAIIWRDSRS